MMNTSSPTREQWRELYDAAIRFKAIECWNYMYDSEVFGVQNPETEEIGYCCIMGNLGEHFALAAYLGTEGLKGYLRIASREGFSLPNEALHCHKCLMASFEDREYLEKDDLQMAKALGLKFRGRHAWPLFRSYLPGYAPWFLTSDEARYLTLVLNQAMDVALRRKDDPELFTPPAERRYLVRVPKKSENGVKWTDEWLEPSPLDEPEQEELPPDRDRLDGIKSRVTQYYGVLEVDSFYSPMGVAEKGERPYYLYMTLCVEQNSGLILGKHLAKASEYRSEFVNAFLKLLEDSPALPREIWVKKEETFAILKPIVSHLGIGLARHRRLPAMEEAQVSLFRFFGR